MKKAEISYIVKSGHGFLINSDDASPLMTSDPVEATRFSSQSAANLQRLWLSEQGFLSELVQVTKALHLGQGE